MTMPDTAGSDGPLSAQILLELGKLTTQVAVISKTLEAVPDHETRLREHAAELAQIRADMQSWKAEQRGGRDIASRLIAAGAAVAAIASPIVVYLHH